MSLGTGVWWFVGTPYKYEAQRFPWPPCEREPALPAATQLHCHTKGTSVEILTLNTVLYLGLPSNKGGKGRVVNLPVK